MTIPAEIIAIKRDGGQLTSGQLADFVHGYAAGSIPDYQMAALAMAICLRGMSLAETVSLTEQMLASGKRLTRCGELPRVDKHSTGGLGDKVSLVLAPLLACCQLQVPMISGRGLGITGGTLDKLEAIPGFRTDLEPDQIDRVLTQAGCVICGASKEIAPADRKLYALRDVTATVESVPLITASILSKKLAESLDALVLDVKLGSGAFMQSLPQARELAETLVQVATRMGVPATALVTDMNQPMGRMVGNAVEVAEAIASLQGGGPADLRQLVIILGSRLLTTTGGSTSEEDARERLESLLDSGHAYERFREMVAAQGGKLPTVAVAQEWTVKADRSGCVTAIHGRELGRLLIELGGGRKQIGDPIDYGVGLEMLVRVGDSVRADEPIARVFAHANQQEFAVNRLRSAIHIDPEATVAPLPLVLDQLSAA